MVKRIKRILCRMELFFLAIADLFGLRGSTSCQLKNEQGDEFIFFQGDRK